MDLSLTVLTFVVPKYYQECVASIGSKYKYITLVFWFISMLIGMLCSADKLPSEMFLWCCIGIPFLITTLLLVRWQMVKRICRCGMFWVIFSNTFIWFMSSNILFNKYHLFYVWLRTLSYASIILTDSVNYGKGNNFIHLISHVTMLGNSTVHLALQFDSPHPGIYINLLHTHWNITTTLAIKYIGFIFFLCRSIYIHTFYPSCMVIVTCSLVVSHKRNQVCSVSLVDADPPGIRVLDLHEPNTTECDTNTTTQFLTPHYKSISWVRDVDISKVLFKIPSSSFSQFIIHPICSSASYVLATVFGVLVYTRVLSTGFVVICILGQVQLLLNMGRIHRKMIVFVIWHSTVGIKLFYILTWVIIDIVLCNDGRWVFIVFVGTILTYCIVLDANMDLVGMQCHKRNLVYLCVVTMLFVLICMRCVVKLHDTPSVIRLQKFEIDISVFVTFRLMELMCACFLHMIQSLRYPNHLVVARAYSKSI